VLQEHFDLIYGSTSSLIKCRIALMLGYFADNMFLKNHDLFLKTIEFLMKGLALEDMDKALSLQSADTLKSVISEQDLVSRLEAFIASLFY
jgi:hypothetical protein